MLFTKKKSVDKFSNFTLLSGTQTFLNFFFSRVEPVSMNKENRKNEIKHELKRNIENYLKIAISEIQKIKRI